MHIVKYFTYFYFFVNFRCEKLNKVYCLGVGEWTERKFAWNFTYNLALNCYCKILFVFKCVV